MNYFTRKKILIFIIVILFISSTITFVALYNSYDILFKVSIVISILSSFLLFIAIKDSRQTKHTILRNYPIIGRFRWLFESERSKIQQYFIEDDINGTPYNREERSDIYQKSKNERNTTPFGTQLDVYKDGYEFLTQSMYPIDYKLIPEQRFTIGSKFCKRPYNASIFNISAMSYGALSNAAVLSLNGGAKLGNFFHNTGEGGLSPYHTQEGGDLCFQIGTGYFGCGITMHGERMFSPSNFEKIVSNPTIKLIEIKISQGAKPGHGGILPAIKNTPEIAQIRGIKPHTTVYSPPFHTAFNDHYTLLKFIEKVRTLSYGKPIGIKLCIGDISQFDELVNQMGINDIYPDFITIDGGEGGTGAAPMVFTNFVGTPLIDALVFVDKCLKKYKLRDEIKIIASGKASNSFSIIKLLALGADGVNAARGFLFSLGCIQARECDKNTCPTAIATQNPELIAGLVPEEKKVRVYNYHKNVIHEVNELLGSMGINDIKKLTPEHICIRTNNIIKNYSQAYDI